MLHLDSDPDAPGPTTDNALIEDLIAGHSEWIAQYLDFTISTVTATNDLYNGNGSRALPLKRRPIVEVRRVEVDGVEVPKAEEATDQGWVLDDATLRLRGYQFARGVQNVLVVTEWGYDEIPKILQAACLKLTIVRYKDITDHPNETYRMVGDRQYRWLPDAMPPDVVAMLDGMRRMGAV